MAISFASLPNGVISQKAANAALFKTTAGENVDLFRLTGGAAGNPITGVTSDYFDRGACDYFFAEVQKVGALSATFPTSQYLPLYLVQASSLNGAVPSLNVVDDGADAVLRVSGVPGADREFITTVQHTITGGFTASFPPYLLFDPNVMLAPSFLGSGTPGSAPGLVAPSWTLRRSFTAGAAGANDDITIFNNSAEFAFKILDCFAIFSAAGSAPSTIQLRSASGGGGSALAAPISSAALGLARAAGTSPTAFGSVAQNGSLFLRREERDCAGEIVIVLGAP